MAEMRPPYSQPRYTAASRISAVSGGRPRAKASGSSRATPLIGPRPGSRPTMVPTKAPNSATSRLVGRVATSKPCIKKFSVSISTLQEYVEQAQWQRHIQQVIEQSIEQCAHGQGADGAGQRLACEQQAHGERGQGRADDEAEGFEQQGIGQQAQHAERGAHGGPPVEPLLQQAGLVQEPEAAGGHQAEQQHGVGAWSYRVIGERGLKTPGKDGEAGAEQQPGRREQADVHGENPRGRVGAGGLVGWVSRAAAEPMLPRRCYCTR